MARRLDLSSSWAKLDRAKSHIDELRAEITAAGAPDPDLVPLRREFNPKKRAVIYRVDRVIEVQPTWPVIVGDAIHDMRCALDHLIWQLAIVHLGRLPTEKEALSIQFPAVHKLKNIRPGGHRFLTHIRRADIQRLKPFQPYRRMKKGQLHPLPKLVRLSNVDKHRRLHLLVTTPYQATFTNRADAFRDCVPLLRTIQGPRTGVWIHKAPRRNPRVNDEILRIFVRPTGPHPDVEVDARLICQVRLGKLGPVVPMLDGMAAYVNAVLTAFQPRG